MGLERDRTQLQAWLKTWAEHWVCLLFRTHNLMDIMLTIVLSSCCQGSGLFKGNGRQYCCFWTSDRLCCAVKNTAIFKRWKWLRHWPCWHLTVSPEGLNSAHLSDSLFSKDLTSCFVILAFLSHPGPVMTWGFCAFLGVKTLVFLCTSCCFSTLPFLFIQGMDSYSIAKVSWNPLSVLKKESSIFICEGTSCIKLISQQIPNSIPLLEFLWGFKFKSLTETIKSSFVFFVPRREHVGSLLKMLLSSNDNKTQTKPNKKDFWYKPDQRSHFIYCFED